MRFLRSNSLDSSLYSSLTTLWDRAGISNPARADSESAIRLSLDHGGWLLLAYADENFLCGSAWLTHDFRRLYIHHMAVLPEMQNQGIGQMLLKEALAVANEYGYQAKLEVHRDNPAARHLYAKYGFTDLDGYITMIRRS